MIKNGLNLGTIDSITFFRRHQGTRDVNGRRTVDLSNAGSIADKVDVIRKAFLERGKNLAYYGTERAPFSLDNVALEGQNKSGMRFSLEVPINFGRPLKEIDLKLQKKYDDNSAVYGTVSFDHDRIISMSVETEDARVIFSDNATDGTSFNSQTKGLMNKIKRAILLEKTEITVPLGFEQNDEEFKQWLNENGLWDMVKKLQKYRKQFSKFLGKPCNIKMLMNIAEHGQAFIGREHADYDRRLNAGNVLTKTDSYKEDRHIKNFFDVR